MARPSADAWALSSAILAAFEPSSAARERRMARTLRRATGTREFRQHGRGGRNQLYCAVWAYGYIAPTMTSLTVEFTWRTLSWAMFV